MAICKLCLKDKLLLNKSHIIPEFMYHGFYDPKHKLTSLIPSGLLNGETNIKKTSSGEFEGGILCKDCDNKLLGEKYEDYACKILYGKTLSENFAPKYENHKSQDGIKFIICKNIDYNKFKLFLLSILWRASISSRQFFSEIKLGPHEEILRNMIINQNPGDNDDYPIIFLTYITENSVPKDLITQPCKIKTKEGHNTYLFAIGGILYFYYVNSKYHKLPEIALSSTIRNSNEFNLIQLSSDKAWDIILGLYKPSKNYPVTKTISRV
jgi:hypothetical protein